MVYHRIFLCVGDIYLFIWLCRVLVAAGRLLSHGMQTLSCSMHVGSSSLSRDRTWAPCIGARSLIHCATREVPLSQDFEYSSLCYTAGPCCLSMLYTKAYIC